MRIKLNMDNSPDADFWIKMIQGAFDDDMRPVLLAFISKEGNTVINYNPEDVLFRQVVKKYFEEMLHKKGELDCRADFSSMINEIERGDWTSLYLHITQ